MSAHLDEPITTDANSFVHFFNGRLLTGEDLSREQDGNERARRLLGLAAGPGVVTGLEVTPAAPSADGQPAVTVEAGLAVNLAGQVLELPARTDVSLVHGTTPPGATPQVLFHDCAPTQPLTYTTGAGVYLLSIQPGQATAGRAPTSGLANGDAGCNAAYSLDGVQFRLLRLSLPVATVANELQLRNQVAHLMFGTGDPTRSAFAANPWGVVPFGYGLLDALRASCLGPDEVPLALVRWTGSGGLVFVDRWAVRRRTTRLDAAVRWPLLLSDRLLAEAEASFLQFQDQVEDMRSGTATATGASPPAATSALAASDAFAFLPPVGILPVAGVGSPVGFDTATFFGAQASFDLAMLDAAQLRGLLWESFGHDAIPVDGVEKIQLY